jgi:hypothetical protein
MVKYIFKRVLFFIPTIFAISLLTFALMSSAPGDPAELMLNRAASGDGGQAADKLAGDKAYKMLRKKLGLDLPLFYFSFSSAASSAKRADYDASINILANALYDVFKHEDLKEACVNYLQQGGNYSQGPVSLLSGLNRNTNVLMSHFFAVALHGAKNTLAPFPTPGNIKDAYKMIKDAVNIVSPLVKSEKPNTAITSGIQLAEKIML